MFYELVSSIGCIMAKRLFFAALLAFLPAVSHAAELLMIERQGCSYCVRWKKDLGPEEYANTAEGAHAPLQIIDIAKAPPEGTTFARPVVFTPTFVLVENGKELARIEGYPGEDFFWGLLGMMLKAQTGFSGAG
jgi:thioredoxin-related protein